MSAIHQENLKGIIQLSLINIDASRGWMRDTALALLSGTEKFIQPGNSGYSATGMLYGLVILGGISIEVPEPTLNSTLVNLNDEVNNINNNGTSQTQGRLNTIHDILDTIQSDPEAQHAFESELFEITQQLSTSKMFFTDGKEIGLSPIGLLYGLAILGSKFSYLDKKQTEQLLEMIDSLVFKNFQ